MDVVVDSVMALRFDDGAPVRAASAIAALGDGWLIAQDDATHAAWLRIGSLTPVRATPPVAGHEVFAESVGTKHLKPDLEAACEVVLDDVPAALLLGSGSSPLRMRATLVTLVDGQPRATVADLSPLYARVAEGLGVEAHQLNLEGACVVGDMLRWFQRGVPAAGVPAASVDLEAGPLVAAVAGHGDAEVVQVSRVRHYDLGRVHDIGLAPTDAVALDAGRVLLSAAAEDTPNSWDDGPVVGSALVLLEEDAVGPSVQLPTIDGRVAKVEGLVILDRDRDVLRLLATVDADDPGAASLAVHLRVGLH